MTETPTAETEQCIACGDEIVGDGVYTQSGVKSDGLDRLAAGESVGLADLLAMDDGPYCSLVCSVDTEAEE